MKNANIRIWLNDWRDSSGVQGLLLDSGIQPILGWMNDSDAVVDVQGDATTVKKVLKDKFDIEDWGIDRDTGLRSILILG